MKALPTIKQIELVGKKEFAATALDPGHSTFVVYVASLESPSNNQKRNVYSSHGAQIAALIATKALTSIPTKNSDFANVFSPELASKHPEHTEINDYAIELVDNWQSSYQPIYNLAAIELETLKTYIKINLANGFIRSSKFLAEAHIFFDREPNGNFQIYVDYQRLNSLTIKNQYLLSLVGESLD